MTAPLLSRNGSVKRASRGITIPTERLSEAAAMTVSINEKTRCASRCHRVQRVLAISLAGFITRPQADIKSARKTGAYVTCAPAACQRGTLGYTAKELGTCTHTSRV